MNKENLIKAANYIATVPQGMFDMDFFRINNRDTHECNSIGCVIGHCVILDEWSNVPIFNGAIDFLAWSLKFFDTNYNEWMWCFCDEWSEIDNTPIGASKRILWLVENGLPGNWRKQIEGESKLCYL